MLVKSFLWGYTYYMLIDSHCHLDFHSFDADRAMVIEKAKVAGVEIMVNAGDDLKSSLAGLELARAYDSIYCTFGVHPNEASKWDKKVEAAFVAAIAEDRLRGDHNIVAVGEIGLDYYRLGASKEIQQMVFREQLRLSIREDLPVVIHCREAFEDTITILEEENVERAVFHCFDGDLEFARRVWGRGWLTSFTGVVSYPKNEALRAVVRECPSDLFMIETDAPFLPHQALRGQRNEPSFLPRLAELIADLRGESMEIFSRKSAATTQAFFGFML